MTIALNNLPTLNAYLNGTAAILLFLGWRAIKEGKRDVHQRFMGAVLIISVLFLCSYLSYHLLMQGVVTRYQGEGIARFIYFVILFTHTLLASIIIPFCIVAVYHAYRHNFTAHVKITRWLFPAWMYVAVTGVIIYLMLYVI